MDSLEFAQNKLASEGLCLHAGPFVARVKSDLALVAEGVFHFYQHYPTTDTELADFHITVTTQPGIRRWLRPQINFELDGFKPFKPMPKAQAFATFEWGFNYCISSYAHQFLIIHAAAVEKHGIAMIMPAQPGAGKSTLTAALVSRGWRLLSDELTLIPIAAPDQVTPICRPINLKNNSIDVMKAFAPAETFGPVVLDTKKGTVAHMRAPTASVMRIDETAQQRLVVFPRYQRGSNTLLSPRTKASSFIEIAEQAFNFNILGQQGFDILRDTLDRSSCFDFRYSNLDEAISTFDNLAAQYSDQSNTSQPAEASL